MLPADCTKEIAHCQLRKMDFLNVLKEDWLPGRNHPQFAIRAHSGLFGTSMSRNCCSTPRPLRKSHFPPQCLLSNFFCVICRFQIYQAPFDTQILQFKKTASVKAQTLFYRSKFCSSSDQISFYNSFSKACRIMI